MRLHRFYVTEKIEPQTVGAITHYPDSGQWRKVFRFTTGDKVILFDGSGSEFLCEIQSYNSDNGKRGDGLSAEVKILEITNNTTSPLRETWLFCALLKKDTFEWVVQKATEMGVSHIVPIIAERSEKKNLNTERLNKIIIEAAEQSGRGTLPVLHDVRLFEDVLAFEASEMSDFNQKISGLSMVVMDPRGEILPHSASDKGHVSDMGVWIGPEGGWTEKELDFFKEKEVAIYSMGPQILRAETAAVASLAVSRILF